MYRNIQSHTVFQNTGEKMDIGENAHAEKRMANEKTITTKKMKTKTKTTRSVHTMKLNKEVETKKNMKYVECEEQTFDIKL